MRYGFGVDVGGTTVKLALFEEQGVLHSKWEIPTDRSDHGSRILPDIAASIDACLCREQIDRSSVIGIGIGVPGSVLSSGVVNRCANLDWNQFHLTKVFSEMTGFPVCAANDANAAALGEFWKGGGQNTRNMVMVTLGTGVGGGIVMEGKLLTGEHGAGAEIGHMVLNREETEQCTCGKYGCVEQYCSATGLCRMARRALAASDRPSLLRTNASVSCKQIFDCGKAGDPVALEILDDFYRRMGEFIANVCILADPEVVVFGGGVSRAGQMLLDGIRPYFDSFIFHASNPIRFALATLGNDAGTWGAFRLVLDSMRDRR